jgi:hypothetical protein
VRVDHGIQVRTKTVAIDPGCASCCVGDSGPRYKAAPLNRPQFPDRCAVPGHNNCSSRLHLSKYGGRLIAKLPLGDYSALTCAIGAAQDTGAVHPDAACCKACHVVRTTLTEKLPRRGWGMRYKARGGPPLPLFTNNQEGQRFAPACN